VLDGAVQDVVMSTGVPLRKFAGLVDTGDTADADMFSSSLLKTQQVLFYLFRFLTGMYRQRLFRIRFP